MALEGYFKERPRRLLLTMLKTMDPRGVLNKSMRQTSKPTVAFTLYRLLLPTLINSASFAHTIDLLHLARSFDQ